MSKTPKIVALLAACILGATLLAGCGGGYSAKDLVQGNLDVIYLDKADADYLKAIDSSAEEAHQEYLAGLEVEAVYFADRYDMDLDLAGEASYYKVIDLLDKIYTNSKYVVGDATKNGDIEVVTVTIYPMDIYAEFEAAEGNAVLTDWQNKYNSGVFTSAAEAEAAWVDAVVAGLANHLNPMSYRDPQTIQVQVIVDTDGLRVIDSNDFKRVDALILAYN